MPHVVKDRVKETSTTVGTSTLVLAGAVSGFQSFSSAIGNGNTTYYAIDGGAEWEVGIGTVGAGSLSRDTVLESSNSGSLVNFSTGTKNVFCTYPAEKSVDIDTAQTLTNKTITGGSINNTPIGATTASTGRFTSVTTPSVTATTNDLTLSAISTGAVKFNTLGGEQVRISDATVTGQYTSFSRGVGQNIQLIGAMGTANLGLYATGGGVIRFLTASNLTQEQFRIADTVSAVNYVQVTGAATGSPSQPIISAQGSDSNINIALQPKGTGNAVLLDSAGGATIRAVPRATSGDTFLDVQRSVNLVTLSASSAVTNGALAFLSKGTGAIDLAAGSSGVNISNGGTVTAITRTAAGSSYTSVPIVNISAPTTAGGVQATAQARVFVWSNPITTAGTGYTVGNTLTAIGGTGTAYSFTVTSINGSGGITGVNIVNFGDYTVVPTSPVTFSGGTGTGFTSNMTWTVGSTFNITNAGSGYIEQPTVTFSGGGGGSGATAYATVGSAPTIRGLGNSLNFATASGNGFAILDAGNTSGFLWQAIGGSGNAIFRSSGAIQTGLIQTSGTGGLAFQTNNGVSQMQVTHTASAVNYVQVTGNVTNTSPIISAQGSDANIALSITSKGTNAIRFLSNNATNLQFRIAGTNAAVNNLAVTGTTAGNAPILSAEGSDTNIDLTLTPKGTGLVRFGTYTNTVSTIAGYIEIRDAGGTIRRLAVVS